MKGEKYGKRSKRTTWKNNFYLTILDRLKFKTNLSEIQKELKISKQQLNYYLRQLKKKGFIQNKGYGWWELTNQSKNTTKYGIFLDKDMIRGHAYIWEIKLTKKPEHWNKRLEIIKKKNIHYKLVGAKKNTPRIKALGRKVWLCNDHLRIFDTKKASYYGETAIDSRKSSFMQLLRVVQVLENKLGFTLRPFEWEFKKEHYALIKNDFAIEQNKKGVIIRISDEQGEWLLVDDSLGMGGELENVGKKAFDTNIPMKKWWNNKKEHNFKITDDFILNTMNGIQQNQLMFAENMESHIGAVRELGNSANANSKSIELLGQVILELKEEIKKLNGRN